MKTIPEELGSVIGDLEVICENLHSLKKRIENMSPLVRVDDYYKILLALNGTKDIIEGLGELKKNIEGV